MYGLLGQGPCPSCSLLWSPMGPSWHDVIHIDSTCRIPCVGSEGPPHPHLGSGPQLLKALSAGHSGGGEYRGERTGFGTSPTTSLSQSKNWLQPIWSIAHTPSLSSHLLYISPLQPLSLYSLAQGVVSWHPGKHSATGIFFRLISFPKTALSLVRQELPLKCRRDESSFWTSQQVLRDDTTPWAEDPLAWVGGGLRANIPLNATLKSTGFKMFWLHHLSSKNILILHFYIKLSNYFWDFAKSIFLNGFHWFIP